MGNVILAFYALYMLFTVGFSVAVYVLQALGFYTIAKRRGIKNPWLAWIPVGEMWIRGCISDQYQYVAKGQVKNKRKWLLGWSIAMWAAYVVFFVSLFVSFGGLLFAALANPLAIGALGAGTLLALGITFLVMMIGCIAIIILQYMALYDLYRSCDPDNAVLFLVLSIFVPLCQIILPLACRKKDLGMPPRRPQPIPEPLENNPER
jgi:hypothetical protein